MSKKKSKKKLTTSENKPHQVDLSIDYDKLAIALLKANKEVEKEIEKEKQYKQKQIQNDRKRVLKEKDYSQEKCQLKRKLKEMFNSLTVIFRFLFLSRANAQYFSALNGLTKMLTSSLVWLIEIVFYALAIGLIVMGVITLRKAEVVFIAYCVIIAF